MPATHDRVPPHVVPQPPQFVGSLLVSTQLPLQLTSGAVHPIAQLPELPDDIQYRFIGRHLILYDVRANTIIDRIPDAIRCTNCD